MSKRISVPEDGIEILFGAYDENLKHLESLFNVRIRTQGQELLVDGESPGPEHVDRVIGQLSSLLRDGLKLSNADVKTASALVAQDPTIDLREHFLKAASLRRARSESPPRPSINASISTPSRPTTSSLASVRREPARPTWPWRRRSRS